jgi:hypothetical protein
MRRAFIAILLAFPMLVACSSGRKAYIPVDSPLRTWTPPEPDAYTAEPAPPPAPQNPGNAKSVQKK